jgi:uncharacterized integral membrane protein
VFLAVAVVTTVVGLVVGSFFPVYPIPLVFMLLTAVVVGVVLQRRVWANRLQIHREELLRQADAQAHREAAKE